MQDALKARHYGPNVLPKLVGIKHSSKAVRFLIEKDLTTASINR